MSGAVTSSEMPGEAELMLELQGGHLKANKRQHSPRQKIALCLHFKMHIFKQQLQNFINGQCITSEKNTV